MAIDRKLLNREILLGFWNVHILHHAAEGPLVGQWMLHELREHGYTVRPGTLYPLLHRMEKQDKRAGLKARREHFLTAASREALKEVLSYLTTDIDTDRGRTLETRLISVSS